MKRIIISSRKNPLPLLGSVFIVAALGTVLLLGSHAASPFASSEVENGALTGTGATKVVDSSTSAGNYVQFGTAPNTGGGSAGGGANMVATVGETGWGAAGADDVADSFSWTRFDMGFGDTGGLSEFKNRGVKLDIAYSGDLTIGDEYNNGGVQAINATNWANSALAWYRSNCTVAQCPTIEVLNEPEGDWFWGSGATSPANEAAYANLMRTTYTTFHNSLGSNSPLVLGVYDNDSWGHGWWSSSVAPYVDGIIVHPYGGTSHDTGSAQGNRALVTSAHNYTGKPIYITEVGWPTAVGHPATGDSAQWTEAEQADNVYNFINWSRGTGYVNAVYIFGYRDYAYPDQNQYMWYGLERWQNPAGADGSKKPAWNALKCAAQQKPQNC